MKTITEIYLGEQVHLGDQLHAERKPVRGQICWYADGRQSCIPSAENDLQMLATETRALNTLR